MTQEKEKAYIWIDNYNRTQVTMELQNLFKVLSGKKITLKIEEDLKDD